MIRGRAKFFQAEKAWQLFQESRNLGLPVDVDTYNALLKRINFLRENHELRWELILVSETQRSLINLKNMKSVFVLICFARNYLRI